MNLKSKNLDYVAEQVSVISKAIKEGKENELPHQIFHYYEGGEILIGVNGIVVVKIDGEYKKVEAENYLLIPSSWGGEIKILKDLLEVKYHFYCTDPLSLDGCPFNYCDNNPKCQIQCRYKIDTK